VVTLPRTLSPASQQECGDRLVDTKGVFISRPGGTFVNPGFEMGDSFWREWQPETGAARIAEIDSAAP
tara:strand:+ start:296 stop:499 length:204 start_codon:yes stop_codon:yes gene_type:complete